MSVAVDLPAAQSWLTRCRFPAPGDGPVDLAVSGGPDSMALLVLAAAAGLSGTVHHVDHGLRPESAGEAATVEVNATAHGFDFRSHRVDLEAGADLEARARRARYEVLPGGVLTGHTMDDQAETVLLNVLRGSALDGWAGMRPSPGRPRRPLLRLRRSDTQAVCRAAGVTPIVDVTNCDPRFRRNRVRQEVLPFLSDVAARDVVPVLARQAELVGDDVSLLEELARDIDPTDVGALRAAPKPLARRALRRWLRASDPAGESHPPSQAELERVLAVVAGEAVACEISGGRRIRRRVGRLHLSWAGRT